MNRRLPTHGSSSRGAPGARWDLGTMTKHKAPHRSSLVSLFALCRDRFSVGCCAASVSSTASGACGRLTSRGTVVKPNEVSAHLSNRIHRSLMSCECCCSADGRVKEDNFVVGHMSEEKGYRRLRAHQRAATVAVR